MKNTECKANNALELISAQCDYKESCTVEATNDVFGDPCIGTIKYLKVDYLCLKSNILHARGCEGTKIKLECKSNSFIDVIGAFYGRAHPFICLKGIKPFFKDGCGAKGITSSVKERCQGKSSCSFPAAKELFGDLCYGYTKYLDVEYICNDIIETKTS